MTLGTALHQARLAGAWAFVAYFALWSPLRFVRKGRSSRSRALRETEAERIASDKRFLLRSLGYAALAVLLSPAPRLQSLGLRLPDAMGWCMLGIFAATAAAFMGVCCTTRWGRNHLHDTILQADEIIPRTPAEWRTFAWTTTIAGALEEVVFRGFLCAVLVEALGPSHPALVVLLSGVVFGLGHLYQGIPSALGVTALGTVMASMRVNGLVFLMIMHALTNLRGIVTLLLLPPEFLRASLAATARRRGDSSS